MPYPICPVRYRCPGGTVHWKKNCVEGCEQETHWENRWFSRKKRCCQSKIQEGRARSSTGNDCRVTQLKSWLTLLPQDVWPSNPWRMPLLLLQLRTPEIFLFLPRLRSCL